jgi:hypothetical protein
MDNGLHQQALRIDEDVALLALDLLPGIVSLADESSPKVGRENSPLCCVWASWPD